MKLEAEAIEPYLSFTNLKVSMFGDLYEKQQECLWHNTTGVLPEDSSFILASPIYNEANMGEGCIKLASLQGNIPLSANAWHIYVTNRCTDNSAQVIQTFLSDLGTVKKFPIYKIGNFDDQLIDSHYSIVKRGNNRYIHINTETPSKANVWRILTTIAKYNKIKIVMSYDTNVGLVNDAVANLFREAYLSFVQKKIMQQLSVLKLLSI